ncbi:50S ribosomal protein L6 [Candidatus Pacearchaeota archaeon]|nr:50S ribosomal protein L6 [Candidatus Pacearchaeota archaeon]
MVRKPIKDEVEIPEGMNAEIVGDVIKISKDGKSVEKKICYEAKIDGKKIVIECKSPSKNEKKLIKTTKAHIKNMISGLNEKYEYKMQICAVHFPMTVTAAGNEVIIKNFLGEKKERRAQIVPDVEVKIEKEFITIKSASKDKAGQTAANIERATKIKNRDRRVFQDGIYITEKQKGATR